MKHLALVATLTLALVASAVPEAISYRGRITRTAAVGKADLTSVQLTFRLYDSLRPDTALWGRTVSVGVETNGIFYVELTDDLGSNALKTDMKLVDALAAVVGEAELGLTPAGAAEFPRQRLSRYVRSYQAGRANAIAHVDARRQFVADRLEAIEAQATEAVTVGNIVAASTPCRLERTVSRELGGDKAKVEVLGGVSGWRTFYPYDKGLFTTASAANDTMLSYESKNGAFNVIVPRGGAVTRGSGNLADDARLLMKTEFGEER